MGWLNALDDWVGGRIGSIEWDWASGLRIDILWMLGETEGGAHRIKC